MVLKAFVTTGFRPRRQTMHVFGKENAFPTGFIRVSASGAKGWEMIDFTQVLPRF